MTLEELARANPKTVKVADAAEIMGITPVLLRELLKQGKMPFGAAVELRQTESYINTGRFIRYMQGE